MAKLGVKPTITVAAAILIDTGRLLIARRSFDRDHPGLWELPGGKIEPEERPADGLERELLEELDLRVAVEELADEHRHEYPAANVRLLCYRCSCSSSLEAIKPKAGIHVEIRLVPIEELGDYEFTSADVPIIKRIMADFDVRANTASG